MAKQVSNELLDIKSQATTENSANTFWTEDQSNAAEQMQMKTDINSENLSQFFKNL